MHTNMTIFNAPKYLCLRICNVTQKSLIESALDQSESFNLNQTNTCTKTTKKTYRAKTRNQNKQSRVR